MDSTTDTQAALIGVIADLTTIRQDLGDTGPPLQAGPAPDHRHLGARITAAMACLEGRPVLHGVTVYYRPDLDPDDIEGIAAGITRVEPAPGTMITGCNIGPDPNHQPAGGGLGLVNPDHFRYPPSPVTFDEVMARMFPNLARPDPPPPRFPWPIQWPPDPNS